MKTLYRLSIVILGLGMLGAAACSGCSQQPSDSSSSSSVSQPQSYHCGAGTHRVGNQCVGNTTSSTGANSVNTLKTTGNN
jgi:hypothetical protein